MDIQDIVLELRSEVPDAPPEFCEERFIRTARQFFRDTLVWREDAKLVMSSDSQHYLPLAAPGTDVVDVLALQLENSTLRKATRQQIGRLGKREGTPDRFYFTSSGVVVVHPDPATSVARSMTSVLALTPHREMVSLPDDLYDRFGDILLSGAAGRLMVMPKRPWTAFDVGRMHLTRFSEEIERWQAKAPDDGLVGVPRRVAYGGY